jgi:hypothetical protein
MEDVLDLYAEPYDPKYPVICFDEHPYQLLSDVYQSVPMQADKPKRVDYEYKREGVCNLFLFFQPLAGWRRILVRETKTKRDFAECMKTLVDEWFPQAQQIRIVCDQLKTHTPVAFYDTFKPIEARRLTKMLEFHYTPKHASWLNMAEIEHSVISRQCLGERIATVEKMEHISLVWSKQRTQRKATIDWRFSTEDARDKFRKLYP